MEKETKLESKVKSTRAKSTTETTQVVWLVRFLKQEEKVIKTGRMETDWLTKS